MSDRFSRRCHEQTRPISRSWTWKRPILHNYFIFKNSISSIVLQNTQTPVLRKAIGFLFALSIPSLVCRNLGRIGNVREFHAMTFTYIHRDNFACRWLSLRESLTLSRCKLNKSPICTWFICWNGQGHFSFLKYSYARFSMLKESAFPS